MSRLEETKLDLNSAGLEVELNLSLDHLSVSEGLSIVVIVVLCSEVTSTRLMCLHSPLVLFWRRLSFLLALSVLALAFALLLGPPARVDAVPIKP